MMSDTSSILEEPTCYPTKGKYIVNAVTGTPTRFLVGSKDERRFWKTLDVSAEAYDPATGAGKSFFFPSPEAYEDRRSSKISKERKMDWRARRDGLKCSCLSAHVCTAPTAAEMSGRLPSATTSPPELSGSV